MSYLNPFIIPVPDADSSDMAYIQDVVGSKSDTHMGYSLFSLTLTLLEHIHSAQQLYPTMASGVTVNAGAAWTLGSFVEIVPASTIDSEFDIHHIYVDSISANDTYELVLYKGAVSSEVEIGRVRFTKNSNFDAIMNQPFQTGLIAAFDRISAKVASSSGSNNVTIGVVYHTY